MSFKEGFERRKKELLNNKSICKENRLLFRQFFNYEEYKLKRQNGLHNLDEGCYKTLYSYVSIFNLVNSWFHNKPWKDLTKADIKKVYDDLEDGKLKTRKGEPFKDRRRYYNKIFKSKPFEIAGKADLAREVITFTTRDQDKVVRFLTEEEFRKLVSVVSKPAHLLLFWLAWDIGENINTLLQLTKKDFIRQINEDTKEPEYLVNLSKEKLKRSRTARGEPTLYPETSNYLDMVLDGIQDDDLVFPFGYRQASKILKSAARKSGSKCMPHNDEMSWKDFRSGMACHLLKQGWTTDEVNFRLGHKPSSREIDVYVSYLAIDRRKPKKKIFDSSLEKIQNELEETKQREKLAAERIRRHGEENERLKDELDKTQEDLKALRKKIEDVLGKVHAT